MYDVVVVGLGGVGSFSLRALAQRGGGLRVLGLERFQRCHDRGSSHGGSRIYRKAYFEHPNYVPMIKYSEQIFSELKSDVLVNCGTLMMEEEGGGLIDACLKSARQHDIETQFLSNGELRDRYPQFLLNSDKTVGLLEPGGGFVRPELAMHAALNDAENNGAEIMEDVIVEHLEEVGDHVEICIVQNETPEVLTAKRVIVSSGPWASTLIPSWAPYLSVTRQLQAWMDVESDESYLPSNFPTWYMVTPKYPLALYGIPRDPSSEGSSWIKFGIHCRDAPMHPSSSSPHLISFERKELMDAAQACFLDEQQLVLAKPCLYTMSRDGHFIVGKVSDRIVAAAGLSGHGFKMTPALGELLAGMALEEPDVDQWGADFLSPERFGVR